MLTSIALIFLHGGIYAKSNRTGGNWCNSTYHGIALWAECFDGCGTVHSYYGTIWGDLHGQSVSKAVGIMNFKMRESSHWGDSS